MSPEPFNLMLLQSTELYLDRIGLKSCDKLYFIEKPVEQQGLHGV